jgi:hypothetical protein
MGIYRERRKHKSRRSPKQNTLCALDFVPGSLARSLARSLLVATHFRPHNSFLLSQLSPCFCLPPLSRAHELSFLTPSPPPPLSHARSRSLSRSSDLFQSHGFLDQAILRQALWDSPEVLHPTPHTLHKIPHTPLQVAATHNPQPTPC